MRLRIAVAMVAILGAVAAPPTANATYDPLGSGTTKLTLDKRFTAFLARDGVKLKTNGAVRTGKAVTLEIVGGNFDPTLGKGEIDNEGSLIFENSRKRVPLRDLVVKTKHSPLIAKVGGSQLKVASSARLSSRRAGFGSDFEARQLKLTGKVATRLNKKLRPSVPFVEGQPLGTLRSQPQPQLVTILATNKATYAPDSDFFAKLHAHFVSVNPIAPAELAPGPLFYLPVIPGGQIAPDGSSGTLRTGGSLELLQLGGGQIFWHEFWIGLDTKVALAEVNVQPSPPYPGKLGQLPVLDTGLTATISPDPANRTISLSGLQLTVNAATAKTLNEAFAEGKEDFKAGEVAGTLSFTAQGQ